MIANLLQEHFRQPALQAEGTNNRTWMKNEVARGWAVGHLNVQPYQHILEIGYGAGHTLQEVARKLKIGFLAGIDASPAMYRQAYRRNKRLIEQQLLQLHIGELPELSYPAHYFHTIYGVNAHLTWKDPAQEFMRLAGMLKNKGRLVMLFQSSGRKDTSIQLASEKIRKDYDEAGLTHIHLEQRTLYPHTCVAAIGYKL